jgi:hypothetical protein
MAMGHIIDIAARAADTNGAAKGSPTSSEDAIDGMLQAVSALLKAQPLDDDVRWGLISSVMQSLERGGRR